MFVVPFSTTTAVSETARRNRAIDSARVAPYAMIFAIMESNSDEMVSPDSTPESTRKPGPVGIRK